MSKTVLEMAQSVGAVDQDLLDRHTEYVVFTKSQLESFAELVRADERNSWPAEMEAMERQVNILTDALAEQPAQQEPWPEEPIGHMAGGVQLSGTRKSKAITELYDLFYAPHNADINLTGLNMLLDELIASPQAQRKPLTDEEIDELSRTMVKGSKSVNWLCRAIEAKLKEKNT